MLLLLLIPIASATSLHARGRANLNAKQNISVSQVALSYLNSSELNLLLETSLLVAALHGSRIGGQLSSEADVRTNRQGSYIYY